MTKIWFVVITALVILPYLNWLLILMYIPIHSAYTKYVRNRTCKVLKILSFPYYIINHLLKGGAERYVIYKIGFIPSHHIRKFFYNIMAWGSIGPNVVFHYGTEIRRIQNLSIGSGTIVGDNAILDARNGLIIGSNVNISSGVSIWTMQHDYRKMDFACFTPLERKQSVEIDDRVWLGSNVEVLPGVHIGEGAVCCAGAIINKDVPPFAVVAGIPARVIGERPKNINYEFDGSSCRLL